MEKMTELEHFIRKENVDACGNICAIARSIESKKDGVCENESCSLCRYYMNKEHILEVLLREYKEPMKLSNDENFILRNVVGFKWIARDKDGTLYLYRRKPIKGNNEWNNPFQSSCSKFEFFNNLFQFVKWEDEEPYNIEELLKEE